MKFENNLDFVRGLDETDPLRKYASEFIFPKVDGKKVIYFTGNSLGLQPKSAQKYIDEIMTDWAQLAVEGHFNAEKPWWDYHERFSGKLAKIVGARSAEVGVMNTLTVNLHLLMVSFYRPDKERYKIICEEKAFPSDQYMIGSQLRFHGLDPKEALVEVKKRKGEHHFRTEDIIKKVHEVGEECALVLMGGVNYYSGQVLNMQKITLAGKEVGAFVGWDLAHAAGNIELKLHDWNVDFAAWCSYKYMNSGPGNAAGYFVHEKYHNQKEIPRFEGWWGHDKKRRFLMEPQFQPEPDANAWQISNPPVLALAPYLAALELFDEVGMPALIEKQQKVVSFLEFLIQEVAEETNADLEIITPSNPEERGNQLSVFLHGHGKELFHYLMKKGVITDWREPNVIRLAPAPFYCSFEDMYRFGQVLKKAIVEGEIKG